MPWGLAAYSWSAGRSKQVVYVDAAGDVHELYHVHGQSGWNHENLTARIRPRPPAARWSLVGYEYSSGSASSKQVAYLDAAGHVHELYCSVGRDWEHADLTSLAGAPPVPENRRDWLAGYQWAAGHSKQVVWLDQDDHLHELYHVHGSSNWAHVDLTAQVPGALSEYSFAAGDAFASGAEKRILFVSDSDASRHEFSVAVGGAWVFDRNSPAAGVDSRNLVGYAWPARGTAHFVNICSRQHLHAFSRSATGTWVEEVSAWPLTAVAVNTPGHVQAGDVDAYTWEGTSRQLVYVDENRHVLELSSPPGDHWVRESLTETVERNTGRRPPRAAARPGTAEQHPQTSLVGYEWPDGHSKQVVYFDEAGNVHEFYRGRDDGWNHADLTRRTGAPRAW